MSAIKSSVLPVPLQYHSRIRCLISAKSDSEEETAEKILLLQVFWQKMVKFHGKINPRSLEGRIHLAGSRLEESRTTISTAPGGYGGPSQQEGPPRCPHLTYSNGHRGPVPRRQPSGASQHVPPALILIMRVARNGRDVGTSVQEGWTSN